MKLPVVAIVGRPNVGKSSLLNRLAGERISIVDPTPGVTRDRISAVVAFGDRHMEVVDTGGIGIADRDRLDEEVERQVEFAVRGADAILMVTDVREGVTPLDREVAARLRRRVGETPLFLVVNKVDAAKFELDVNEFYELGLGEPLPVSAREGFGITDLLERVTAHLRPAEGPVADPAMKVAVVGCRNAGKSTFVNALAQEERVIVSEVPGTTRDAVDVRIEKDGRVFVLIDTAGVQRRRRIKDAVEFYSQVRTELAVRRADVVLFLLDATKEVTRADKKISETIASAYRPCVLVANKWDLTEGRVATEVYAEYLRARLPALAYAPVVFTTAKEARNVQSAVDMARHLHKRASVRVTTGELNRVVELIRTHHRPPLRKGKKAKIYYATQVGTSPPTFVLFVNDPELFTKPYRRYLESSLREAFPAFDEVPIRVLVRRRESIYNRR